MPTYAILGATGQTGSELVKHLLPTSNHLNIYARSAPRLASKHPTLTSAPNVSTFIGDLSDPAVIDGCLANVDLILSTVAQNQNEPGCSIARRTAAAIIASLERLGAHKGGCPRVIFLSSFSCDHRRTKRFFDKVLYFSLSHVYTDLEEAIRYLESREWIPLSLPIPGGLVHSEHDHKVELLEAPGSDLLSYRDLAKGMIQIAEDDQWVGQQVGLRVNEGRPIDGNPAALLKYLIPGLIAAVFPSFWLLLRDWWPV